MALALDGSGHATGTGTTLGATLTTTAADALIALAMCNGSTIGGITDNSGVTAAWTLGGQETGSSAIALYYTTSTAAFSGKTITASYPGTATFATLDVCGISGANLLALLDGSAVIGTADPLSITTTNANDMLIGGFRQSGTASPTNGSGYTLISGANFQLFQYKILSSAGVNSFTDGAAGDANGGVVIAIKQLVAAFAFQLGNDVQSSGLAALALANKIVIVSGAVPTSYANAVTNTLGVMAFGVGNCFGAASDNSGPPANMQISSVAVTAGSVTANGTPTGWAVLDDANSRLLAWGPLTGAVAVTSGQSWTLGAFTIQVPVQ